MSGDGFNPLGSGPAPIGPRDEILYLQEVEEAALVRAERAILTAKNFAQSCVKTVGTGSHPELSAESQHG